MNELDRTIAPSNKIVKSLKIDMVWYFNGRSRQRKDVLSTKVCRNIKSDKKYTINRFNTCRCRINV